MGEKIKQDEKTVSGKNFEPVFSPKEIQNRVRGFVSAFLDGQIRVGFLRDEEITANTSRERYIIIKNEHHLEKRFLDLVQTCSGNVKTDSITLEYSYYELSKLISKLQMLRRIEGDFTKPDVEERIKKLEDWKKETNPLIKEVLEMARGGIWEKKE